MRSRNTGATHSRKKVVEPFSAETAMTSSVSEVHPVVETPIARDSVASLAYSYWEARGYSEGSPEQDWLRAEQELRSR